MLGVTGGLPVSSLHGLANSRANMPSPYADVPKMGDDCQNCDARVNFVRVSSFVTATPKFGRKGYGGPVPRTDENGRQLKALLDYLLDGEIEAKDVYDALGVSSSTYYRRIKEVDYPDAEELRRVADRFNLSFPDLQVRFGLMSHQAVRSYLESAPVTVATVKEATMTRRLKLSELRPRQDAPPL